MTATRIDPGLALLGMALLTADDLALDSVGLLVPPLARVPAGALTGDLERLHALMVRALELGRPPTVANLLHLDPSLAASLFIRAKEAAQTEGGYNGISAALTALTENYALARLKDRLTAALAATQKGQLTQATTLLSELDLGSLLGPDESETDFIDFELPTEEEVRPFKLSHDELNVAIGGGLGCGGALGMSLWVLPSNMGKSSLWYGEVAGLCEQGNWVLYCAGEASAADVFSEVVRLRAGMTMQAFSVPVRRKTPVLRDKAQKALDEIRALQQRGQFRVLEKFNPSSFRSKVLEVQSQMRQAGATGKLICIIDNYDSMFSELGVSGDNSLSAIQEEMNRFFLHTRAFDYHIAWLAQASSEAAKKMGPCEAEDVYGNKSLRTKMGLVVTGYRPITPEAKAHTTRDGEPGRGSKAWLAVRKLRGPGENGKDIEMQVNNPYGAWKELNTLPF